MNIDRRILWLGGILTVVLLFIIASGFNREPNNETYRQQKIEAESGKSLERKDQAVIKKSSIVNNLPAQGLYFRIDYGPSLKYPNKEDAIVLLISAPDAASRRDALNWIRGSGYDPSDLEIVFKDLEQGD